MRQVSSMADIDQSTMSKIERNELIAPRRIIKPLSERLGVEYRELQIKFLSEKIYYELKEEVGLTIDLEEITGRQIDLVEEGYVLPNAKKKIEEEKVLIYERKAG